MKKILIITLLALSFYGCEREKTLSWVSLVVNESFNNYEYTVFEGKGAKKSCINFFEKQLENRKKIFNETTFESDIDREIALIRLGDSHYFPVTAYKTSIWSVFFVFVCVVIFVLLFGIGFAYFEHFEYMIENWTGRPLTKKEKAEIYKGFENEYDKLKNKYDSECLKTKMQEDLKGEAYLNYVKEVLKNQDEFALDRRYATTLDPNDCVCDFDNFYCVAIINKELEIIAYNEFREGYEPKRISIQELHNKKQFFASE